MSEQYAMTLGHDGIHTSNEARRHDRKLLHGWILV